MTDEAQPQTEEARLAKEVAARRGRKPNKPQQAPKREVQPAQPQTDETQGADAIIAPPPALEPRNTKSNLVRVIMKRHYHPINDFMIGGKEPTEEQRVKVFSGTVIDMDRAEAKACYEKGIVAPYDPFG